MSVLYGRAGVSGGLLLVRADGIGQDERYDAAPINLFEFQNKNTIN